MEIEINFNDTYKEPIGSPRPRFRNAGNLSKHICRPLIQNIRISYKVNYLKRC